ncbi:hypothetical protein CVV68_21555 [Arthrobacter livingstonensis]|uniref:Uncharacterized protein n=1 Tax=Arthrobacter livingstonensis TaxID=670078 RepID=A0A2V5LSF6_9MICC|nr:hypothetical protein [Arthrobacter livingstonensis]PYI64586.1 hypothetical protein CVV68_21555 [Arthrobacter livingstonensis]
MNSESTPFPAADPPATPTAVSRTPWSWWLVGIVVLGALLTATGGLLALHPAGESLHTAGQSYADYFLTRNLAMAVTLLLMLALRARRALTALMLLTALIQVLDAITASFTGRLTLVPIDLVFAAAFLLGATHLAGRPLWRATTWHDTDSSGP